MPRPWRGGRRTDRLLRRGQTRRDALASKGACRLLNRARTTLRSGGVDGVTARSRADHPDVERAATKNLTGAAHNTFASIGAGGRPARESRTCVAAAQGPRRHSGQPLTSSRRWRRVGRLGDDRRFARRGMKSPRLGAAGLQYYPSQPAAQHRRYARFSRARRRLVRALIFEPGRLSSSRRVRARGHSVKKAARHALILDAGRTICCGRACLMPGTRRADDADGERWSPAGAAVLRTATPSRSAAKWAGYKPRGISPLPRRCLASMRTYNSRPLATEVLVDGDRGRDPSAAICNPIWPERYGWLSR